MNVYTFIITNEYYFAAERYLFGYPVPVAPDAPFSLQHPILTTIIWLVLITAIFMPLAGRKFRRATSR